MPRAEIDHLESVGLLRIGNDRKTIIAPDFILCRLFCVQRPTAPLAVPFCVLGGRVK